MTAIAWFPLATLVAMVAMTALYLAKYRGHPIDVFVPAAAWLRAGIYFCFCYLMAWYSGALPAALAQPWATPQQLADPLWQTWVLGLVTLISVGYWVIWARFTTRFERRLELLPQIVFGLLWGLAAGFLFLSFWYWVQRALPGLPVWGTWLISYLIISIWQWLWQDYGWDVYISPEHDCPWSIMVKVPATHIPNVTLCLIFFALYGNHWVFVGLQTWALLGASIAMRMPSPWNSEPTPPANQVPGLFGPGRPRASGYISADILNDPRRRSTGLPAGTAIWLLLSQVLLTLLPLATIALVLQHENTLRALLYQPQLLLLAALLMMGAGIWGLARNSFQHFSYDPPKPGSASIGGNTLTCLALACIVSACFGEEPWIIAGSYLIALLYPLGHSVGRPSIMPRNVLVVLTAAALYTTLGSAIALLPLLALFFCSYFERLLLRTKAQFLAGLVTLSSGFSLVSLPLAIFYLTEGVSVGLTPVLALAAASILIAVLLWRALARLSATENAHQQIAAATTA